MNIPFCILEEHHEVFALWHYFYSKEAWSTETQLVHVDEHSDLELPCLAHDIPPLCSDFQNVLSFVQKELSIDSFLLPAFGAGFFSHLHWLYADLAQAIDEQRFVANSKAHSLDYIAGRDGRGMRELAGNLFQSFRLSASRSLSVLSNEVPFVLDIDLDYFACHPRPLPKYTRLEVPENSFLEFQSNPLHPMRLAFGSAIRAKNEEGRYFLCWYECDTQSASQEVLDKEKITARMHTFCELLASHTESPRLITVARSRFSGYTKGWETIEQEICARLSSLYRLQPISMKDLV